MFHSKSILVCNQIIIVGSLGFTDLVPYYLPFMTTLMLLVRCHQLNQRNKRWVIILTTKDLAKVQMLLQFITKLFSIKHSFVSRKYLRFLISIYFQKIWSCMEHLLWKSPVEHHSKGLLRDHSLVTVTLGDYQVPGLSQNFHNHFLSSVHHCQQQDCFQWSLNPKPINLKSCL